MAKILLSIPDDILGDIDKYCAQFKYERSELIRAAIRTKIYPKDIPPSTSTIPKENIPSTIVPQNTQQLSPEEEDMLYEEKLAKLPEGYVYNYCTINHAHPFVANMKYNVRRFNYEDENGTSIIEDTWACDDCIQFYKDKRVGKVTYGKQRSED
jgi:hypothetical protein